ncbi:MAG: asparaginase domain-containing protein [Burkholderiaceae bacterium]
MSLRIIATGGTFDKRYDEISGTLSFGNSHLAQAIARARAAPGVILEELPLLDSLEMRQTDRERVLAACQAAAQTALVIVHGTDTMTETAAVLAAARMIKTIVLTGAMIPYVVSGSDALFNLGFACAAAQTLAPDVYVAMNAMIFPWNAVRKNRIAGIFEASTPVVV